MPLHSPGLIFIGVAFPLCSHLLGLLGWYTVLGVVCVLCCFVFGSVLVLCLVLVYVVSVLSYVCFPLFLSMFVYLLFCSCGVGWD